MRNVTLRFVERGWYATGVLGALWGAVGGRDKLAELTGIQPATLSGYNTGRLSLGERNAARIAAALDVSLAELGAPAVDADPRSQPVADRLAKLEAEVADLAVALRASKLAQERMARRVAILERAAAAPAQEAPQGKGSTRRGRRAA